MSAPLRAVVACLTCLVAPPVALALGGPRWLGWAWLLVPLLWVLSSVGVALGLQPVVAFVPTMWALLAAWLASAVVAGSLAWRHASKLSWGRGLTLSLGYVVLSAALTATGLWTARSTVVQTSGMQPALFAGDRVVMVGPFMMGAIEPGDVVQFSPPNERSRWIRRVVAVGGQTVRVDGENVWIDGQEWSVHASRSAQRLHPKDCATSAVVESDVQINGRPVSVRLGGRMAAEMVVPEGAVFVLGDDGPKSLDSRHIGPIPIQNVRARVAGIGIPSASCGTFSLARAGGWR